MAGWSEGGEWGMVGNDVRGAIGHGEESPFAWSEMGAMGELRAGE